MITVVSQAETEVTAQQTVYFVNKETQVVTQMGTQEIHI